MTVINTYILTEGKKSKSLSQAQFMELNPFEH